MLKIAKKCTILRIKMYKVVQDVHFKNNQEVIQKPILRLFVFPNPKRERILMSS